MRHALFAPPVDWVPGIRRVRPTATMLLWFLGLTIFVLLVWFGASGVRGSDQYWYVADVESLTDGRGAQTNEIYPVSIWDEIAPLPRPFVQNALSTYVVAVPGLLLGAYASWIVTNVAASVLTAFLIYRTVVRFADPFPASLAAVLYLLLPLTVWQTMQPLAEASIAPLVALAALLFVSAGAIYYRWALLVVVSGLLLLFRDSFLPLLLVIPLAYLLQSRSCRPAVLARATGLLALGVVFWAARHNLFEPHIAVSYGQVFANAGPNVSNMNSYFDLAPEPLALGDLVAKAFNALDVQFTRLTIPYFLFYLPFNLMAAVPVLFLLRSGRPEHLRAVGAALFFFLLHLVTVMLVQNQFRYLLVATPALLIATGVALGHSRWLRHGRTAAASALLVMVVVVPPSAALSWKSHIEGLQEQEVRSRLSAEIAGILPAADTVMIEVDLNRAFEAQIFGFVLRPRRVLYVPDSYDPPDYQILAANSGASWLLSRPASPVLNGLEPLAPRAMRIAPPPFDDRTLFLLDTARPEVVTSACPPTPETDPQDFGTGCSPASPPRAHP